jgi:hypothetical protein
LTQEEKLQAIAKYMGMGLVYANDVQVKPADGALVFCREDPAVAAATATLYHRGIIRWMLLTGGIGKDSGEKSKVAGSEAMHQKNLLVDYHHVPVGAIRLETKASNGAENSRFGIDEIVHFNLPHEKVILVVHPRNARRVYATHTKIAREEMNFSSEYQVVCTHDPFNPNDPAHRKELLSELLRVADWPAKGWSDPQTDLPKELVEWVREVLASQ